jgi:hypothetical protein
MTAFDHPFLLLVGAVALVATLVIGATAVTLHAIERHERGAHCASMGETWRDATPGMPGQCVDPLDGNVAA